MNHASLRLSLVASMGLFFLACGGSVVASESGTAGAGGSGGSSTTSATVGSGGGAGPTPVACTNDGGGWFTACVASCGEDVAQETTAAQCKDGHWACEPGKTPAVACPAGTWPMTKYGDCGPWVDGHDCTSMPACKMGLWGCP